MSTSYIAFDPFGYDGYNTRIIDTYVTSHRPGSSLTSPQQRWLILWLQEPSLSSPHLSKAPAFQPARFRTGLLPVLHKFRR